MYDKYNRIKIYLRIYLFINIYLITNRYVGIGMNSTCH